MMGRIRKAAVTRRLKMVTRRPRRPPIATRAAPSASTEAAVVEKPRTEYSQGPGAARTTIAAAAATGRRCNAPPEGRQNPQRRHRESRRGNLQRPQTDRGSRESAHGRWPANRESPAGGESVPRARNGEFPAQKGFRPTPTDHWRATRNATPATRRQAPRSAAHRDERFGSFRIRSQSRESEAGRTAISSGPPSRSSDRCGSDAEDRVPARAPRPPPSGAPREALPHIADLRRCFRDSRSRHLPPAAHVFSGEEKQVRGPPTSILPDHRHIARFTQEIATHKSERPRVHTEQSQQSRRHVDVPASLSVRSPRSSSPAPGTRMKSGTS